MIKLQIKDNDEFIQLKKICSYLYWEQGTYRKLAKCKLSTRTCSLANCVCINEN